MLPQIDGFDVLSPVGSGAMSSVWRARERKTGAEVALKILHPHAAVSPGAVERFVREVRAYERLRHPNVIACLRGGLSGESWYVALEFLGGGDLRRVLRAAGRLPPPAAAFVLAAVLEALAHAHRVGVIHRDVKPENVMLAIDGTPKLADFGISTAVDFTRLTEAGRIIGTPAYMAPEQVQDGVADQRSDLWSAGVLLYEMVTGMNPFAAEHSSATVARILGRTPAPMGYRTADVPDVLEEIAHRLLARDPAERPARAEDVRALLDPILASGGDLATAHGLASLAADPEAVLVPWREARAEARLRSCRAEIEKPVPNVSGAFLLAAEALVIDPSSREGAERVEALARRVGSRPGRALSSRALELERVAQEDPSNVIALVNLVRLARGEGDLLAASRAYHWARRRSPHDAFAFAQLVAAIGVEPAAHLEGIEPEALRARLAAKRGGGGATTAHARSLVASPAIWAAAAALVLVIAWRHRPPSELSAQAALPSPRHTVVARRALDTASVYLEKAAAVADRGEDERALAIYDRFLAQWPREARVPEALFRSARLLEELGRTADARRRYEALLASHPRADSALPARRRLATLLEATGEIDQALDLVEHESFPGDAEDAAAIALERGRLLEKKGREDAALAVYDEVLAGKPPSWISARARLGRGRVMLGRRDPDARRWLEEAAREAEPGTPLAREAAELVKRATSSP